MLIIKKIELSNFNTKNVIHFEDMFSGCSSLLELNLSNFHTSNAKNMMGMFYGCTSLKELNLSNFNTDKVIHLGCMFIGCSNELKEKIKAKYKNIKKEAFD